MKVLLCYWWVPYIILFNIFYAFVSLKSSGEIGVKWFWISVITSILGIWYIVAKITPKENMVFAAFLYDFCMLFGFQIGLIIFGATKGFNWLHWVGMSLIMVGFMVFKIGEFK